MPVAYKALGHRWVSDGPVYDAEGQPVATITHGDEDIALLRGTRAFYGDTARARSSPDDEITPHFELVSMLGPQHERLHKIEDDDPELAVIEAKLWLARNYNQEELT